MIELMGIQLDPWWVETILSPAGLLMFSFPFLFFVTAVVVFLEKPIERLVEKSPKLAHFVDWAKAKGPREGWSGYIIAALTLIFIFACAIWAYTAIKK